MLTIDLFPYQEPAVDLLLDRGNALLAMDMGLGKTVTAIAAAEHLLGTGEVSTVLVCAPSGLLNQWAEAVAEVTDVDTRLRKLKDKTVAVPTDEWCVVVSGTPERKRGQIEQIKASPPAYVIASYDTVAGYVPLFRRLAQLVVIDEVTVLKGFKSARSKALCRLETRWRLGLSGTPVENDRPEEIWGILRWIDPSVLGPWREFERRYIRRNRFGRPVGYDHLDRLHGLLSKVMYRKRRTDPDVAPYMPEVKNLRWEVNLDAATRVIYTQLLTDLRSELEGLGRADEWDVEAYYGGTDEQGVGAGRAGAIQVAAQMLLDHPELLRTSAQSFLADQNSARNSRRPYVVDLAASGALENLTSTPKLDLVSRRVTDILTSPDTKVILVTQFRGMLPLIERRLSRFGVTQFHGGMTPSAKAASAAAFEGDPAVRVILMTHAGAYGLDLPSATHLINYDPARSAGQKGQIDGRHVRASSSHDEVYTIDVVSLGTIEEWRYDLLDWKNRVASAITDGDELGVRGGRRTGRKPLTSHVVETLGVFA